MKTVNKEVLTIGSKVRVKPAAIKDHRAPHYEDKQGVVIYADLNYARVKWENAWTSFWKVDELEVSK